MAGRPERTHKKNSVRVHVSKELYRTVRPLVSSPQPFRSFSQFFEALVFSLEATYVEMAGEDMPRLMRDLKVDRLLELNDFTRAPAQHDLHMTLDETAVEFMDFLCERFPVIFADRNEVVELMLRYVRRFMQDPNTTLYLAQRLHQALEMHPVRPAKRSGPTARR